MVCVALDLKKLLTESLNSEEDLDRLHCFSFHDVSFFVHSALKDPEQFPELSGCSAHVWKGIQSNLKVFRHPSVHSKSNK